MCGLVGVAERRVTLLERRAPQPLLITGSSGEFVATNVGAPIGVATGAADASNLTVPPGRVLLAFTDGLTERPGESPDVSLARLQGAAIGYDSLDDMLDGLLRVLTPEGGNDDTAILAVTWRP